jgi:dolichol-phosphate mannosyltransferase
MSQGNPKLDIVIPVYNEGENIIPVLRSLRAGVKTPYRVLICYDKDTDNTLEALKKYGAAAGEILLVKNTRKPGPHGAVTSGFDASTAEAVIMLPADDTFNAPILDKMYAEFRSGSEIVCASRFIPGGCMEGCPWLKHTLVRVAAFTLHYVAFLPSHDPTNGFRLFSRRVLETVEIESTEGFTYALELLVKVARLGWKISEVPAAWHQREKGVSRFKVFSWAMPYLEWYFYGFSTTYFRRGPASVRTRSLSKN